MEGATCLDTQGQRLQKKCFLMELSRNGWPGVQPTVIENLMTAKKVDLTQGTIRFSAACGPREYAERVRSSPSKAIGPEVEKAENDGRAHMYGHRWLD